MLCLHVRKSKTFNLHCLRNIYSLKSMKQLLKDFFKWNVHVGREQIHSALHNVISFQTYFRMCPVTEMLASTAPLLWVHLTLGSWEGCWLLIWHNEVMHKNLQKCNWTLSCPLRARFPFPPSKLPPSSRVGLEWIGLSTLPQADLYWQPYLQNRGEE